MGSKATYAYWCDRCFAPVELYSELSAIKADSFPKFAPESEKRWHVSLEICAACMNKLRLWLKNVDKAT